MAGQLIDEYPWNAKRNGCLHCGSPRRPGEALYQFDQMVDEVIDLDGNTHAGSVAVICETCMVELGTIAGCATPAQTHALRAEVTDLLRRLKAAEETMGSRRDIQKALGRITELAGDLAPVDA